MLVGGETLFFAKPFSSMVFMRNGFGAQKTGLNLDWRQCPFLGKKGTGQVECLCRWNLIMLTTNLIDLIDYIYH